MAQLVSIIETAEAITAEATAYVWEEYDAPRKRIPRARIIEHRFTVSIPKATEEAAPVAFVLEHFPQMAGHSATEYRAGYDEPIRYYAGSFYAPVRMDYRHRHRIVSQFESTDPRERLTMQIMSIREVGEYERTEYADKIARHEQRADEYPARSDRAEQVERQAEEISAGLIIIGGELWEQCKEPAYDYSAPGWFSSRPGFVTVSTDYSPTRDLHSIYGATDLIALAYHHAGAARYGYIRVLRPDLVTIDNTGRRLQERSERTQDSADSIRQQIAALTAELEEEERAADKARTELETYQADRRAYWAMKAERLETLEDGTPFRAHHSHRAAATRRALEMCS